MPSKYGLLFNDKNLNIELYYISQALIRVSNCASASWFIPNIMCTRGEVFPFNASAFLPLMAYIKDFLYLFSMLCGTTSFEVALTIKIRCGIFDLILS
jgi:hypothetical protein